MYAHKLRAFSDSGDYLQNVEAPSVGMARKSGYKIIIIITKLNKPILI